MFNYNNRYMNPYNPYQPKATNYMEQFQTQSMPNYNQMTMTNNLIRVNGIEGAKAYQMQPNSTIALFDGNEDIFYVKNSDGGGFSTVKAYRFIPIENEPFMSNNNNSNDFVSRKEFEEFKNEVMNYGKQLIQEQPNKPKPKSAKSITDDNAG